MGHNKGLVKMNLSEIIETGKRSGSREIVNLAANVRCDEFN